MLRPDASFAAASPPLSPPGLLASAIGRCPSARLRNSGSCSFSSRVECSSRSSAANAVRSFEPASFDSSFRVLDVLGGVAGSKNAIRNASRRVASVDDSVWGSPSPTR